MWKTVIVVDMSRLHLRAKILYTKLSDVKNTLNYPNKYWSFLVFSKSSWATFKSLFPCKSILFLLPVLSFPLLSYWRQNNVLLLHLLQPSTCEITAHHVAHACRDVQNIVNRLLSPWRQNHRYRETQTAPPAAAPTSTLAHLNVRCAVQWLSVCFVDMTVK